MKSKIAGVALAAVVGACAVGMSENAEASSVVYAGHVSTDAQYDYGGKQIGTVYGDFNIDPLHPSLSVGTVTLFCQFACSPFYPVATEYKVTGISNAQLFNDPFATGAQPLRTVTISSDQGGFGVFVRSAGEGTFFSPYVIGYEASFSADLFPITVPLPASGALLGAAIATLGGLTATRRQMQRSGAEARSAA